MAANVYIADDHAVMRDGLRAIIEARGEFRVVGTAGNGREAVRAVCELRPDIVILDIAMPELNGIEVARQIRDACPETAVVMLSMHSNLEHVYQALKAGARGYIVKESAGDEVLGALRTVRNGRRYLSPVISDVLIDDYVSQRDGTPAASPLERLSDREREVLQLVVEGKSSAEIAESIFLSQSTVESYRSRLMKKLGVADLPQLVKFAVAHGITPSV